MEFGYYPAPLDFEIDGLKIGTLPTLNRKIKSVEKSKQVEKDWLYCPRRREQNLFMRRVRILPYNDRIFGLPTTHSLTHAKSASEEHLNFLVQVFGFFVGMRMSSSSAGFLDSTPIKPGSLTDFYCDGRSLERAMSISDEFWRRNSSGPRMIQALLGAIHAMFISRNRLNLDFEKFLYLCMSLEGCYLVKALQMGKNPRKLVSHSDRIPYLCAEFGLEVPDWAQHGLFVSSDIAIFRNEMVHEALFFGKPLGFQIFGGNDPRARKAHTMTLLQMQALICRFVVALLGATNAPYVKSPINTRGKWGLNI
jgi:hypothetical protein